MELKEKIKNAVTVPLTFDAPMKLYTTYKAGGAAEVLALPSNENELKEILAFAKDNDILFRVLGLGSNILVSDLGLEGITCCLKNMKGVEINGASVTALAGTALDKVVADSVLAGLGGLEGLSGIPGSVGGAVYMNAGAYNQETFDSLKHFTVMDLQGNIKTINKEDIKYGYRKVEGIDKFIILSATWLLTKGDALALKERRAQILAGRIEKQPLDYPSAGSVFKRPQGSYASKLIDECGLKGLKIGGAMVSAKHAGFIINYDNATAADIKNLMDEVQSKVFEATGYKLELEQILWGGF